MYGIGVFMLTIDKENKKSVRAAFGQALVEIGKENKNFRFWPFGFYSN